MLARPGLLATVGSMGDHINYSVTDHVGTITIDRPAKRNAIVECPKPTI